LLGVAAFFGVAFGIALGWGVALAFLGLGVAFCENMSEWRA
jgi:hypothetical protein